MIKLWFLFLFLILTGLSFADNASAKFTCETFGGETYCFYTGGPGRPPPP